MLVCTKTVLNDEIITVFLFSTPLLIQDHLQLKNNIIYTKAVLYGMLFWPLATDVTIQILSPVGRGLKELHMEPELADDQEDKLQ